MAKRYEATKTTEAIGSDTEVWSVRMVGRSEPVGVWRDAESGKCYCTRCSGPLAAMLTSCEHARAVKRTHARLSGQLAGTVK